MDLIFPVELSMEERPGILLSRKRYCGTDVLVGSICDTAQSFCFVCDVVEKR
jgi:hypothetical protein